MGALSKRINFPLGALEAEAKAAECGLICAWELGLREVIIKGDSQVVIMLCLQSNLPLYQSSNSSRGQRHGCQISDPGRHVLHKGTITKQLI